MYLDEDKVDEAGERISEVFTGLSKARGGPGKTTPGSENPFIALKRSSYILIISEVSFLPFLRSSTTISR